jgi:protein-S-isoprenylcysteine O-methyltransferase Ste14
MSSLKRGIHLNSWKADPSGWIGAVILTGFAGIAFFRWTSSGFLFFALLVLRDLSCAWFFISRRQRISLISPGERQVEAIAYLSCAIPLLYMPAATHTFVNVLMASDLLSIVGFAISTVALFELGGSFGVVAANRGGVRTGLYRYLSHPMYAGYVLAEFGFVLVEPRNIFLFSLSVFLYLLRARQEGISLSSCV